MVWLKQFFSDEKMPVLGIRRSVLNLGLRAMSVRLVNRE